MLSPLSRSYMSTSALLACSDSHQNKNHDGHGYGRAEQKRLHVAHVSWPHRKSGHEVTMKEDYGKSSKFRDLPSMCPSCSTIQIMGQRDRLSVARHINTPSLAALCLLNTTPLPSFYQNRTKLCAWLRLLGLQNYQDYWDVCPASRFETHILVQMFQKRWPSSWWETSETIEWTVHGVEKSSFFHGTTPIPRSGLCM